RCGARRTQRRPCQLVVSVVGAGPSIVTSRSGATVGANNTISTNRITPTNNGPKPRSRWRFAGVSLSSSMAGGRALIPRSSAAEERGRALRHVAGQVTGAVVEMYPRALLVVLDRDAIRIPPDLPDVVGAG